MKLLDPNLLDVLFITRHLREKDRRELFATRWDDDADRLAMDVMRWGENWWVAGDGRAIAVVGATETWPGVWSAGMFATDEFPRIGLSLTRAVRRRIIPHVVSQGAKRIECRSIEGHDIAHRWLASLGFAKEAEHKRYGKGGETFFTFVLEV